MKAAFRWLAVALMALLVAIGPAGDALAQSPPRPPDQQQAQVGKVDVSLMVVYAHNENNRVDPALKPVMQNLRFLKFSGFTLQDDFSGSLGINQETGFNVVGGRKLKVKLLSRDEKAAKVRVRLYKGEEKVLDTTVSIHRNKSFMLGGPKHDQGVLVFAVSVGY